MRRAPRTRFLLAAAALTGLFWLAATPVCAGPATDRLREFFGTVNGVLVDPDYAWFTVIRVEYDIN